MTTHPSHHAHPWWQRRFLPDDAALLMRTMAWLAVGISCASAVGTISAYLSSGNGLTQAIEAARTALIAAGLALVVARWLGLSRSPGRRRVAWWAFTAAAVVGLLTSTGGQVPQALACALALSAAWTSLPVIVNPDLRTQWRMAHRRRSESDPLGAGEPPPVPGLNHPLALPPARRGSGVLLFGLLLILIVLASGAVYLR
jgi:hypothetical protein